MWPFESSYPQRRPSELQAEYDYIIVGGGTAGCVLARRLAEERKWSVLVVERGDARDGWLDKSPLFSTYQFSDKKHGVSLQARMWEGKKVEVLGGKGLGGTSRINGMQWTRGVPGDYNAWGESGREGWSYDTLKPYFERAEGHWNPATLTHYGRNGPLQVEAPPQEYRWGVTREIVDASEQMGFALCNDVNDAKLPSSGCFLLHLSTSEDNYRSSTFRAYLPKAFALAHREKLHLCTNTVTRKVEVEKTASGTLKATGVIIQDAKPGSSTRFIAARKEVIVCCGALTSPKLLLLSGIGPAKHLQEIGIPVVHELEGVGSNLQDHMGTPMSFYAPIWDTWVALFLKPWWLIWQVLRYLIFGVGWLRDYYMETSIYTRADYLDENMDQKQLTEKQRDATLPENIPDIEIMFGAVCDIMHPGYDKTKGGYNLLPTVLRPQSRGTVRLSSSDPLDPPVVDLNYLSAPADRVTLRTAARLALRLVATMDARGYATSPIRAPALDASDAELDAFLDADTQSFFHYSSTCRMAPRDAREPGVVDDALRVHGVPNLRVCDASVFPQIPAAHTQAPVIAVAERCADIVKAAAK